MQQSKNKTNKKHISLTKAEYQYLCELLSSEVFKLEGLKRVTKSTQVEDSLKSAESIIFKVAATV